VTTPGHLAPWNYPDVSIPSTRGKRTCIIAFTAYAATNSTSLDDLNPGAGFTFFHSLRLRFSLFVPPLSGLLHAQGHIRNYNSIAAFPSIKIDPQSAIHNFERLSNMLAQAGTYMLKAKMQALKDLYASRHYTQCATFGERLLGEINDEVCKSNSTPRTFHDLKVAKASVTREKQVLTNNRSILSTLPI
jgi:hypothetical protein